jgi:hypothetical protein
MINCLTFQIVKSCIVVLTVGMNDGKKDAVYHRVCQTCDTLQKVQPEAKPYFIHIS